MILGEVRYRGLIPNHAPIFVSKVWSEYNPKPKTVNAVMYAEMLKNSWVLSVYEEGKAIMQDDAARLH